MLTRGRPAALPFMFQRFDLRCDPPRWARGGHAQTLLGFLLPCPGGPLDLRDGGVERRVVELDDGDRIVVFDGPPLPNGADAPATDPVLAGVVVHLFHGLTGSSDSNYVRLIGEVMRRSGARVVAFNHRGQGAGEGLARGIYHSGSAPDLFASIAAARALHPDRTHLAIGFSLSGNCLLLGAGRDRDRPGAPDAVLAINPPVALSRAVHRMGKGANRLYDKRFVLGMRQSMAGRIGRGELDRRFGVSLRWSLRQADHVVTAPLAGFASGEEYYSRCSAAPWIGAIRVPAVILTSADDPFIDPRDVEDSARDTNVFLHVEETGGHLGYLASLPAAESGPATVARRRWLGSAVLHYARELTSAARSRAARSREARSRDDSVERAPRP